MKKNPALNTTSDTAAYGQAEKIPDQKLLNFFVHLYSEALLEVQ